MNAALYDGEKSDHSLRIQNMERMLERASSGERNVSESREHKFAASQHFCKVSWYVSVFLLVALSSCILSVALYAGVALEPRANSLLIEAEGALRLVDANLPMINQTMNELSKINWTQLVLLAEKIATAFENGCKKYPWLCESASAVHLSNISSILNCSIVQN